MRIVSCLVLGLLPLGPAAAWACADVEPASAVKECVDETAAQTAKEHYALGFEAAEKRDYESALQAFKKAYAACPHVAILYNIGQAQIALDRRLDAIAALSHYLREGQDQIPPERVPVVKEQIRLLENLLGELHINTVPPGALITIDGCKRGRTPLAEPIWLEPGVHKIWATLDDYEPAVSTVAIGRGKRHDVTLHLFPVWEPPPLPPPRSGLRVALPYLLAGTGVALGGVALGVYLGERDAYEQYKTNYKSWKQEPLGTDRYYYYEKQVRSLSTSLTRANRIILSLAITGGVLVAAGASLYLIDHISARRSTNLALAWNGGSSIAATWGGTW